MIGKAEWFQRRKYGGWGLSPRTWQGWAYIAAIVALLLATNLLPAGARVPAMIGVSVIFCIDFVDILMRMKKDEREKMHEAIAERNVAWVMIAVLAAGIGYQTATGVVKGIVVIDPFIIAAIAAGLLTKIISNILLDRTD